MFDIIAISETRITKQVFLSNNLNLKACVFYFIKGALFVLEIFKLLSFCLPLFFSLSAIALVVDSRKILKFMMSSTV